MKVLVEPSGAKSVKWIRLRFYYRGRRVSISTGLSWNDANLALANQTAAQIVSDIYQNNFDESLLRYRPLHIGRNPSLIAITELFDRFSKYKASKISPNSLCRYDAVSRWLKDLLSPKTCDRLTKKDAQAFVNELSSHVKSSTLSNYLSLLKSLLFTSSLKSITEMDFSQREQNFNSRVKVLTVK